MQTLARGSRVCRQHCPIRPGTPFADSRGHADDSVREVVDEAPGDHPTPRRAEQSQSIHPALISTSTPGNQENSPVVAKNDDFSGSDRIQKSVHVVCDALEAVLDGRGRLGRLVVAELGRAEDPETAFGKSGNLCDRMTDRQFR